MINFVSDGDMVQMIVEPGGPLIDTVFTFEFAPGCEWQAKLLSHYLNEEWEKKLMNLKHRFYRFGVKHGRAKCGLRKADNYWPDLECTEIDE